MMTILFTLAGFFLGALPFSVWIGRFLLGKDIRQFGDHNPGATNVLRAGNFPAFSLALALDISKGAAPVGLAYHVFAIQDWRIIPIALAPTVGHAFSPFLNWRGGKAIAASFGVWIGLTLWQMPLVSLLLLIFFTLLLTPSAWAVVITLGGMLIALLSWLYDPVLILVWAVQMPLLLYLHREELARRPAIRFLQSGNA